MRIRSECVRERVLLIIFGRTESLYAAYKSESLRAILLSPCENENIPSRKSDFSPSIISYLSEIKIYLIL